MNSYESLQTLSLDIREWYALMNSLEDSRCNL